MKFLVILPLFMVTLLARNRKYLIEVEDENEIINEKEKNHVDEENLLNHEEKNIDEEKNVKSRKVFLLKRLTIIHISNVAEFSVIKVEKGSAEQSI